MQQEYYRKERESILLCVFNLFIAHVVIYRYINFPTGPEHIRVFMGSEGVTEAFKMHGAWSSPGIVIQLCKHIVDN